MLIGLKGEHRQRSGSASFAERCKTELPNVSARTIGNLLAFGKHLPLLEKHKPESQHAALVPVTFNSG